MEDFIQIALFILFAIFSLVSNLLNKKKKRQAETRKPREQTEADTRRPRRRPEVSPLDPPEQSTKPNEGPTTLEEILRELTGGGSSSDTPSKQEEIEDDYEHPFAGRKAKETAKEIQDKTEAKVDTFEQSVQEAKGARRISDKVDIEQEVNIKRLEVKAAQPSAKKRPIAADIAKSLKDPDGARKAIILSEIIKPKYF